MNIKVRRENIRRAVTQAGGEKKVGDACGVTFQAVQHWIYKARVPAKHIITLERMSKVTRHEIDDDIYPESIPCTAPKPAQRKKKAESRASR
jgi:DNA-binding transcriptional regulator YdaS (Cro superfamily)